MHARHLVPSAHPTPESSDVKDAPSTGVWRSGVSARGRVANNNEQYGWRGARACLVPPVGVTGSGKRAGGEEMGGGVENPRIIPNPDIRCVGGYR